MSGKARYIMALLGLVLLLAVQGCDIHEWPEVETLCGVRLQLRFPAAMQVEYHPYDPDAGQPQDTRFPCQSQSSSVDLRYIIRAYPIVGGVDATAHSAEFVFTRPAGAGWDAVFPVQLPAGRYRLMVWADRVGRGSKADRYYDTSDFSDILLCLHEACTDERDAFYGYQVVALEAAGGEAAPRTLLMDMERPLAKFEFITNDLDRFLRKELAAAAGRGGGMQAPSVGLDDYEVVFYYSGFMPDEFDMFTHRPVDSATGASFRSVMRGIGSHEASLGFDYVFVNGRSSTLSVRVGLFDKAGRQVSMSKPVVVPVRRNTHTIMRGSFLMENAGSGIVVDPGYEGDHNIILP